MKKLLILLLVLVGNILYSQTRCESQEDNEDLNVISVKKCLVEDNEKEDMRKIKSTGNSNRFMTVRKVRAKEKVLGLSTLKKYGLTNKQLENKVELESLLAFSKEFKSVENFNTVDVIPSFRACKKVRDKKAMKYCFNSQIINFVHNNLVYPDDLEEEINGRISVKFIIDTNGKANNITVTGDKNARTLKEEIIDLIGNLPKLTPAIKNTQNVPVEFEFMLNFTM